MVFKKSDRTVPARVVPVELGILEAGLTAVRSGQSKTQRSETVWLAANGSVGRLSIRA